MTSQMDLFLGPKLSVLQRNVFTALKWTSGKLLNKQHVSSR
jgi:hypothetical protein